MPAEDFANYCEINKVWASTGILEKYEENNLLLPIYRLMYPEDYVRTVILDRFPSQQVVVNPPEWLKELSNRLDILKDRLSEDCYKMVLSDGHPLDWLFKKGIPEFFRPNKDNFIPWKEYIVSVKIEGREIGDSRAEHYYAPWQIFALEKLNENHTILENFATGYKKGWGILRKELIPSRILKYSDIFQSLTEYMMIDKILYNYYSQKGASQIPEEKSVRDKEAQKVYLRHTHNEWINLIRKMIEIYVEHRLSRPVINTKI